MNTQDDVQWLREVLTAHDPADPGRSVLASPRPRNHRDGTRWTAAALAAAAVITAIVVPVAWSRGVKAAATLGSASPSSSAAQPVPAPRPGYDHLRWQEFDGTVLTTTTQWWWNGVDGRELKTDRAGKVVSDVTLALPPPSIRPTAGDPTEAVATLAPTSGTDYMADNFPGTIPTTAVQLRSYLDMGSTDDPGLMTQRIPGLVLQRVVSAGQMRLLVTMLNALPMKKAATAAVSPDGRRALVLHPRNTTGTEVDSPVLDESGTSIVGTTSESDGRAYWRMLSLSEISATTR